MRLADGLARRRIVYPRPLPTLLDIVLLDLPAYCRSPSLPFGRYYPVIVETDREWAEWDAFLHVDRPTLVAPDLLDRRRSALIAGEIAFAHYDPRAPGWSWILLCRWPADHVAIAGDRSDLFARSAYTIEITTHAEGHTTMQDRLFRSLGRQCSVEIFLVPPSGDARQRLKTRCRLARHRA